MGRERKGGGQGTGREDVARQPKKDHSLLVFQGKRTVPYLQHGLLIGY